MRNIRGLDSLPYHWPEDADLVGLIEECHALGWTDGLPVIPPTKRLVEAMLGPWAGRADEVVATLAPTLGEATLEAVAANCVLAGCLPAHLPVVIAAIRAVSSPRFALDAVSTGVNSVTPVVIVDGPICEQLEFNSGAGALGAGNRANASIGRAVQLCIRNIGGARTGELDAATHGHPGKYSYIVVAAPSPWPTLRERLGFSSEDSIVTVYAADAPLCIADMGHEDPLSILETVAQSVSIPGSYNAYLRQELWLVMSPEHAGRLHLAGYGADEIAEYMYENATIEAGRLRGHGLYGFIDASIPPTWMDGLGETDLVSIVDRPSRVKMLVSGGLSGGYTSALLGQGVSVSERIVSQ